MDYNLEQEMDRCLWKLKQVDFTGVVLNKPDSNDWASEEYQEAVDKQLAEQGWTRELYLEKIKRRPLNVPLTPQQILLSLRCRRPKR